MKLSHPLVEYVEKVDLVNQTSTRGLKVRWNGRLLGVWKRRGLDDDDVLYLFAEMYWTMMFDKYPALRRTAQIFKKLKTWKSSQ